MVYDQNNNLSYIKHPEGNIAKTGTAYVYNYRKTDQVGSTRVLLAAASGSNTLTAQQTTEYYPFGLSYTNSNLNVNKFLFSGKELQDGSVNGSPLGLYDFHARLYDPVTGRWPCQDRLRQFISPYLYAANNPAGVIDPSGLWSFSRDSTDMWGRNRFDDFSGVYIPYHERQGGAHVDGWGSSESGYFVNNYTIGYAGYNYKIENANYPSTWTFWGIAYNYTG